MTELTDAQKSYFAILESVNHSARFERIIQLAKQDLERSNSSDD